MTAHQVRKRRDFGGDRPTSSPRRFMAHEGRPVIPHDRSVWSTALLAESSKSSATQFSREVLIAYHPVREEKYRLDVPIYTQRVSPPTPLLLLASWRFRSAPNARKPASQAVLSRVGRMQLTLRATRRTSHGASRLVRATPTWSPETRRAPSRHCI